jgi:hypothetical protein
MRRDQLEHAIRTACQIIQRPEVIVVGSQAILGTYDELQLPAAATRSIKVYILPIADSNDETARLADLIEGVAGELSPFEELHGFSIDGVDPKTAVLPDGWRDRPGHGSNLVRAGQNPPISYDLSMAPFLRVGSHRQGEGGDVRGARSRRPRPGALHPCPQTTSNSAWRPTIPMATSFGSPRRTSSPARSCALLGPW